MACCSNVLTSMGSSVLSGITLTKFGGIVVLAFAKSHPQITECHIKSDNAGNFHSDFSLRFPLRKTFHQMKVVSYLFNDPGKKLVHVGNNDFFSTYNYSSCLFCEIRISHSFFVDKSAA